MHVKVIDNFGHILRFCMASTGYIQKRLAKKRVKKSPSRVDNAVNLVDEENSRDNELTLSMAPGHKLKLSDLTDTLKNQLTSDSVDENVL